VGRPPRPKPQPNMNVASEDLNRPLMEWYWYDHIIHKDGREEWTEPVKNLIVDTAFQAMAGSFGNIAGTSGGIQQHAMGAGLVGWDVSLPLPTLGQVKLVTEIIRKVPDTIDYIDAPLGTIVAGPTSIIRVQTTLDFADLGGGADIREQGLFGANATGAADSGLMIDAVNHVKIFKDSSIKLIRFIELQFSPV